VCIFLIVFVLFWQFCNSNTNWFSVCDICVVSQVVGWTFASIAEEGIAACHLLLLVALAWSEQPSRATGRWQLWIRIWLEEGERLYQPVPLCQGGGSWSVSPTWIVNFDHYPSDRYTYYVWYSQGQYYRGTATSDIHRQMPTHMADIRCEWLTNQNTDWCFVVIGLVGWQSHSPLLQLKIDPVRQLCLPYWLASSGCQRIFINTRGQYGIQKNIYIYIHDDINSFLVMFTLYCSTLDMPPCAWLYVWPLKIQLKVHLLPHTSGG